MLPAATINPSGLRSTFRASFVIESVSAGCDALFLALHGGMVTKGFDDPEGEVLNATLLGCFPLADIPFVGLHGIVVTDDDAPRGVALSSRASTFALDSNPSSDTS